MTVLAAVCLQPLYSRRKKESYIKEHRDLIYDLACSCVPQNEFEENREKYFECLNKDGLLQEKNGPAYVYKMLEEQEHCVGVYTKKYFAMKNILAYRAEGTHSVMKSRNLNVKEKNYYYINSVLYYNFQSVFIRKMVYCLYQLYILVNLQETVDLDNDDQQDDLDIWSNVLVGLFLSSPPHKSSLNKLQDKLELFNVFDKHPVKLLDCLADLLAYKEGR
ncbi:hypothetical protein K501DRAFT_272309 [Backusella circina FSU 941]|nr:hypothetical protein K501DRAFT_272309 [Backusella circina FSU 941]